MEAIKRLIIDTLPEGVLKFIAKKNLDLIINYKSLEGFTVVSVNINLPNLNLKAERFIDTSQWWIENDLYDYYRYYTPEELDTELSYQIIKLIAWIKIKE